MFTLQREAHGAFPNLCRELELKQFAFLIVCLGPSLPFRFSCTDSLSWTANQSDLFDRQPLADGLPIQHVESLGFRPERCRYGRQDTTVRDTPIWVGRQDAHRRPKWAWCARGLYTVFHALVKTVHNLNQATSGRLTLWITLFLYSLFEMLYKLFTNIWQCFKSHNEKWTTCDFHGFLQSPTML